jgi:hypothetical protein
VRRLLAIALIFCAPSVAPARPSFAPDSTPSPHPAVVRIIAVENSGMSMGSGSLVAVSEKHGMVITNWHVVRDATGPIQVVFPDGFMSPAWLLKADRVWDLAALGILRPGVPPIPLSVQPPQPGQRLTIAGYGPKGAYRAVSGRCTDYFSPGGRYPREWVEVSVSARQGDSGGPIFNDRGELAGVLFGANPSSTMGSYCGRVRNFLSTVNRDFDRLPNAGEMIAQRPPAYRSPAPPAAIAASARPAVPQNLPSQDVRPNPLRPDTVGPRLCPGAVTGGPRGEGVVGVQPSGCEGTLKRELQPDQAEGTLKRELQPNHAEGTLKRELQPNPAPAVAVPAPVQSLQSPPSLPPSRADQIKTILAAVGALLLLLHGIRLVGAAVG